ncbi:MAG: hypothetical protein MUO82_04055 [Candidatus Thermoplasmatota archaeon]|nr:hypothetical protein [Candidatus Thermoplasmatota archaeon]
MDKKIIVFGSFLAVFLMLMLPGVNAIEHHQVENNITEKQEIYENKKDTPPSLPRLYMRMIFHYHEEGEFKITNVQADKTFNFGKRTIYIGNVTIEGKLSGNAWGQAYTFIAGKIYNLMPYRASILPGFYEFEGDFTIKARYFCLIPNQIVTGNGNYTGGRGLFVRIY